MKTVVLHTHLFIALCAVLLLSGSQSILQLKALPFAYYMLVGMGTMVVYNLHRAYGLWSMPRDSWPPRFYNFYRLRFVNAILSLAFIFTAGWLLYTTPRLWNWVLFPPILLVMLYILPMQNGRNLRQVPFLKIFIIAITWVWVTTFIPLMIEEKPFHLEQMGFLLHRLLFVFAITIPFDIRDIHSDQLDHVFTLPSYYGVERSKRWAVLIAAGSFVPLPFLFESVPGSYPFAIMYLAVAIITLYGILNSSPQRSEYYFGYFLDGCIIFLGGSETLLIYLH